MVLVYLHVDELGDMIQPACHIIPSEPWDKNSYEIIKFCDLNLHFFLAASHPQEYTYIAKCETPNTQLAIITST